MPTNPIRTPILHARRYRRIPRKRQNRAYRLLHQIQQRRQRTHEQPAPRITGAYGTPQEIYKDKTSGLNENRKGLQQAIKAAENGTINVICATYNDRLTRFGISYIKHIFETADCEVRILHDNIKYSTTDELMNDFMALIASFSGRFYRLRTKNNQKKLLNDAEKLIEQGNEE